MSKSGTGTGTVTSSPPGIDCGATCSASFDHGTVVTLAPAADISSAFTAWSGACTGSGACVVTMGAAKAVTATFTPKGFVLTVKTSGSGSGTVTSSPAGIDCGATCSASFSQGTAVTLTPTADATSDFESWSGACTGTDACVVAVDAAKSVTATFTLKSYSLAVSRTGAGTGTVTSTPTGIECGATCSAAFKAGTVVTLNQIAIPGSQFGGWSGACSGSGTCQVTMDQEHSVSAAFEAFNPTLTVAKTGTGTGTVTSNPAGIDCGNGCSHAFAYGTSVTLAPTPGSGHVFSGWAGACTGTGTCTVAMTAEHAVTAEFNSVGHRLRRHLRRASSKEILVPEPGP